MATGIEIATLSVQGAGLIVQIVAFGLAMWKYADNSKKEQARHQREYFEKMMEKFLRNRFRIEIHKYDTTDGADGFIGMSLPEKIDGESKYEIIDELLFLTEHLCYLLKKGMLSEDEFNFFEFDVKLMLSCEFVQRYLKDYQRHGDGRDAQQTTFQHTWKFINEKDLEIDALKDGAESDKPDYKTITPGSEIKRWEVTVPIMIVKIKWDYHEGMSEDEIYKVRGEWRINRERAEKYKVAVYVADGIVRAVFAIDKWEESGGSSDMPRWSFARGDSRKIPEAMRKWAEMKRSVKNYFPRGASNPIRYLDPKEEEKD